jgi:ThiF family protein
MTMTKQNDITERVFSRNPKERELLKRKRLVVAGTGSVGSAIALMAARAGLGRFTLIDLDRLEPENVGRHFCALDAVGRPKVEAVADLIRRINPDAAIETLAADFRAMDRTALAAGLDSETLLVGATDSFECQSLVNQLSLETGTSAVYIGCWGEATVGEILYVVPDKTPCFECYAGFRRQASELSRNDPRKYTDLAFDQTKVPGQAGLWPNILLISGFGFQVILALLGTAGDRSKQLLDLEHTLFLANVGDAGSALPFWAVTPAIVAKGCAVCDPARVLHVQLEEV